ncbi:MAG: acetate uptake transporter [Bacillota bacterium]|nr:acetate uptake transporter [Bacillota bacterium]
MADERVQVVSTSEAIADPGPLGLAGFAMTTFILSATNAGRIGSGTAFLTLAFFYGGLAQLLAGMWEYRRRNTFGATAFSSYGAFWIALASMVALEHAGYVEMSGDAMGFWLLAWTVFTFYMWIGSFRLNNALLAVFTLLFVTFLLLTLGAFGSAGLGVAGGWTGIATALVAWYASAAGVINDVSGRVVLPVGPRNTGAAGPARAAARAG